MTTKEKVSPTVDYAVLIQRQWRGYFARKNSTHVRRKNMPIVVDDDEDDLGNALMKHSESEDYDSNIHNQLLFQRGKYKVKNPTKQRLLEMSLSPGVSSGTGSSNNDSPMLSRRNSRPDPLGSNEAHRILHMEKIPFDKDHEIVVLIDKASGLPPTTTVTRLHTSLYLPSKQQIHTSGRNSFCDLQSEYTHPTFGTQIRWKGGMIHPTMTIVIRIDTLEAPHLKPRTIGHCAVRLCVNSSGMQPISEVVDDDKSKPSILFNVGQFMLPILYGTLSSDLEFMTEFKMQESYPHIDNAFLRVGILALRPGEPIPEQPFSQMKIESSKRPSNLTLNSASEDDRERRLANHVDDPLHCASTSVYSTLLKTYLPIAHTLELHPEMSKLLIAKFSRRIQFEEDERPIVMNAIYDFVRKYFLKYAHSATSEIKETVKARYLLEYSTDVGAMASLDLLHNLPIRKKLINAAQQAGSVAAMRTGLSRAWDNKISYYKTVFRYLPGALPPKPTSTTTSPAKKGAMQKQRSIMARGNAMNIDGTPGTNPSLVIDDASVNVNFSSTEVDPEYVDDFSCTAGLALGPNACLLVVVTAVDVLTSKRAPISKVGSTNSNATQYVFNSNEKLIPDGGLSRGSSVPAFVMSPQESRSVITGADDNQVVSGNASASHGHAGNNNNHSTPSSSAHAKERQKQRTEKLRGLRGIYVGHNDPKSSYWGIVPLFSRFPKPDVPPAPSANKAEDSQRQGKGSLREAVLPLLGGAETSIRRQQQQQQQSAYRSLSHEFTDTLQYLFPDQKYSPTAAALNAQQSRSAAPNGYSTAATLPFPVGSTSSHVFVNDGLFQVPLFQGLPPSEMVESPDPFAWLITKLAQQISNRNKLVNRNGFFGRFPGWLLSPCTSASSSRYAVIVPTNSEDAYDQYSPSKALAASHSGTSSAATAGLSDKGAELIRSKTSMQTAAMSEDQGSHHNSHKKHKKHKKKKKTGSEDVILSNGCSAFVRLVDPRMKRLLSKGFSVLSCNSQPNDGQVHTYHHHLHDSYNPETDSYFCHEHVVNDILYLMSHVAYREIEEVPQLPPPPPQPVMTENRSSKLAPIAGGKSNSNEQLHSHPEDDKTTHTPTSIDGMGSFAEEKERDKEKPKQVQNASTHLHEHITFQFDMKKFKELRNQFNLEIIKDEPCSGPAVNVDNEDGTITPANNKVSFTRKLSRMPYCIFRQRQSRNRNFLEAIPDTIDKEILIQEINSKFYEVLSNS